MHFKLQSSQWLCEVVIVSSLLYRCGKWLRQVSNLPKLQGEWQRGSSNPAPACSPRLRCSALPQLLRTSCPWDWHRGRARLDAEAPPGPRRWWSVLHLPEHIHHSLKLGWATASVVVLPKDIVPSEKFQACRFLWVHMGPTPQPHTRSPLGYTVHLIRTWCLWCVQGMFRSEPGDLVSPIATSSFHPWLSTSELCSASPMRDHGRAKMN